VLKTKKYKCTLPSVNWLTLDKVCFAECPGVALGKAVEINRCREPLDGTRQRRRLCRVPPIWHAANHILKIKKKSLPSAASRALGKEHQLSQTDGFSFFSLSLALTRSRRRRPRSPPTLRPAPTLAAGHAPPSPPATRRPRPCARSPALAARPRAARAPPVLTACLLRRRRPRADDLHAVDRSRPPRRHAR
jgi:hypothetical protein